MNKIIRVYEHQVLKSDDNTLFGKRELELLDKFRGDREDDDFDYYSLIHNGVKFKQFVGVLCVGNLQIEVLPKADRYAGNKEKWRTRLINMLSAVYKLKVDAPTDSPQKLINKNSILDIFIRRLLDEVERLLHIGLVKTYRKVEDNCNALKGKLLVNKQISRNMVHKERFYVSYTTYDRNHICNRILYKALGLIPYITGNSYLKNRAATLFFEFPELNDIVINDALFQNMTFDRKTEDYRMSMELAKLLLLHYMPNLTSNNNDKVLALMFDMNKLWEEYVYVILRRQLKGYNVYSQNIKTFWRSEDGGRKKIRPDIVVMNNKECKAVLDTKWKCPYDSMPADDDLKQMYVYHMYWNTDRTCLLYPGDADTIDGHYALTPNVSKSDSKTLHCSMAYLPIDDISKWLKIVFPYM